MAKTLILHSIFLYRVIRDFCGTALSYYIIHFIFFLSLNSFGIDRMIIFS